MSSEFIVNATDPTSKIVRLGQFAFDTETKVLTNDGRSVPLPPKTCELLGVLIENQGKVLSKQELLDLVWRDSFVEESNLTHHIASLRRTFGPEYDLIETLPRRGYRFRIPETVDTVEVLIHEHEKVTVTEYYEEPVSLPGSTIGVPRWLVVAAIVGIVTIASVFGGYYLFSEKKTGPVEENATVITTLSGNINSFDISNDGKFVAFSWNADRPNNTNIYVQLIGSGEPLQLTAAAGAISPAWSADDKTIAFLRHANKRSAIYLIPALGGSERKLCDLYSDQAVFLTWSPDGKYLAVTDSPSTNVKTRGITLIDAETGSLRVLTKPPADSIGDFKAVFSNDSKTIVFSRENNGTSQTFTIDVSGENERLLLEESVYVQNFVWSSDNSELLYSAKHGAVVEVFSLAIGSNEKPKYVASLGTRIARISSDQKGSIYALQAIRDTNIWKTTYDSGFQNQIAKEKLVSSPRTDESPSYSNDNRRISFLSDRSGADEIWIANADGSDPRQLSKFEGPLVVSGRWSPDDTKIGCHVSFGQDQDVYWLNTATGKPTKVTSGGKHLVGGWSADGKSLYYVKFEDARSKLYKTEIDSGTTVLVVDDATISFESPDGQFVYFAKASEPGVWRVPSSGGEPQVVGDASVFPGLHNGTFQADAAGIYLIDDTAKPGSIIRYLDHSSGSINEIARIPRMPGLYHYPSRDGRTWLSSQTDYTAAEIIKLALR